MWAYVFGLGRGTAIALLTKNRLYLLLSLAGNLHQRLFARAQPQQKTYKEWKKPRVVVFIRLMLWVASLPKKQQLRRVVAFSCLINGTSQQATKWANQMMTLFRLGILILSTRWGVFVSLTMETTRSRMHNIYLLKLPNLWIKRETIHVASTPGSLTGLPAKSLKAIPRDRLYNNWYRIFNECK